MVLPIIMICVCILLGSGVLFYTKLAKKNAAAKSTADPAVRSANEFVNVKDIRGKFLYTRDGQAMRKYLPQYDFAQQEQEEQTPEQQKTETICQYKWNAKNIKIAVAGSQRRSGVTVTAFNLAAWLAARGAEVCYVEMNMNRHLQMILNTFEAPRDGEHYTVDGIDCYLTNELDRDYHFIIYDCGVMTAPTSCFKSADIRLICGSVLPYELSEFHRALTACGGMEVGTVALCVPEEMKEYCRELFGEDIAFADASHDLFANNVNGQICRPLVQEYISGEKR